MALSGNPVVSENIDDSNSLKIIALWDKIIGQEGFRNEEGHFGDRSERAIGRLNIPEKRLEIIVQQDAHHGTRTIMVSRLQNGLPLVTCTIPRDSNEDTTIKVDGKISDASEFYDGVIALLEDQQIGTEEVARLTNKKAETILGKFV